MMTAASTAGDVECKTTVVKEIVQQVDSLDRAEIRSFMPGTMTWPSQLPWFRNEILDSQVMFRWPQALPRFVMMAAAGNPYPQPWAERARPTPVWRRGSSR
jgi:hypothetical protein